jgi:hypothetical protein
MAYIGNAAPSRFVSNRAASVYSGDGSTVAFTLEQVVTQDEDVLVSVDGVVQEPSVAYAVSSGTTLTFTAAPSNNAGNNIFVYYLASQAGTIGHPSSQALSATNGTFSGNTTVAGTSTFTGDVTIGDASAADKKILFDGNAQDFHIGLDDSIDSLTIGKGSALGTTTSMVIDANGIITKPLQPAFQVLPANTDQANLAINTTHTIVFGTERFDNNADFASNTFTAPVTGKYQLNVSLYFTGTDADATYIQLNLVTSNKTYYSIYDPAAFDEDPTYWTLGCNVLADMDASDTALVQVIQGGGSAQLDIAVDTNFSGYLVA